MHSEFDLIARYFTPAAPDPESGVVLGVGDDCALLAPTPGCRLAVSVDTSVCGVHFPPDAPPEAVGHRALAVSLSDLAAMGARARWCFMSLSLEESEDAWLEGFSRGFLALCETTGTRLAGGDITRGELAIGVTVMGEVAPEAAMTRGGGRPGDLVAVTGALGGGAGGLAAWQAGERDPAHPLLRRYLTPRPRLAAGEEPWPGWPRPRWISPMGCSPTWAISSNTPGRRPSRARDVAAGRGAGERRWARRARARRRSPAAMTTSCLCACPPSTWTRPADAWQHSSCR